MKAAIYCRVSTEDQGKEGTSLGSQLAACLEKARVLEYDVADNLIFKETYSGLQLDRPQFNLLRQKAKNGEFDAVIAYSPDRLSRNGLNLLTLIQEFKDEGVKLLLVREQFEDSDTGEMTAYIFGWASGLEAKQIKERTKRGKRAKVQQGILPQGTGIGLYGYNWSKDLKKRVPIDSEVGTVRQIFNMISEGLTRFEVAKRLNEQKIPTKSGCKWHPLTIERMVTNPSYIGTTYFGKTVREGKKVTLIDRSQWIPLTKVTPPIISQELFDRAQRVLQDSKELHRGRPQNEYLLTGHVRCGYCNSPTVGACLTHKYRYYHCRATYPTSVKEASCRAGYINADILEDIVWSEARKVIEHPDVILADLKRRIELQNIDRTRIETELTEVNQKIQGFEDREKRLLSLFEFESINQKELLERIGKIKAEKQDIERRQTVLQTMKGQTIDVVLAETQITEFCRKVRESLDNCTFINKRLALDILQVQILATPEKVIINMAVPLEFTTIERKIEYDIPPRRKRDKRLDAVAA